MFQTLIVSFREGVEAFLIIAITLAYLRQTQRTALVSALHAGVVVALLGSLTLGVVLARYGAMQPIHEGVLALAAFVLVLTCTWHMMRHGKRMAGEIRAKVDAAADKSSTAAWLAMFAFVLLMIGREGVETATMIASLAQMQTTAHLAVGGAIGLALAGLLAWGWARYGKRINLTRFFQVTAVFMVIFSVQLAIYAFHEFAEAGAIPGIDNAYWHDATEVLAEGWAGQLLSLVMVLAPMGFIAVAVWRDRAARRASAAQADLQPAQALAHDAR
jgi:high-affinity iron transporter